MTARPVPPRGGDDARRSARCAVQRLAGRAWERVSCGFAAPSRHAGRLGLVATVLVGLGAGFLLGGQAAAVATRDSTASTDVRTQPSAAVSRIGVDLDGDGRLDLARPVDHAVRGVDAYGSGAFGAPRDGGRRAHQGVDLVAAPGEPIRAPISGIVTRLGEAYGGRDGLTYVEIANPATRYIARVLYVGPAVPLGRRVAAGDFIGQAQDLAGRYPAGMTNHVHVELTGRRGGRLDPLVVLPTASGPDRGPTA